MLKVVYFDMIEGLLTVLAKPNQGKAYMYILKS